MSSGVRVPERMDRRKNNTSAVHELPSALVHGTVNIIGKQFSAGGDERAFRSPVDAQGFDRLAGQRVFFILSSISFFFICAS